MPELPPQWKHLNFAQVQFDRQLISLCMKENKWKDATIEETMCNCNGEHIAEPHSNLIMRHGDTKYAFFPLFHFFL